jgi:N-acetylmuramic acid 6-phosphate etherase
VLNAITTTAMVRAGKVFENLMVDLRPGSAKLRDRAVRIVATATSKPTEEARDLLEQAGQEVKTAIVMGRTGFGAADSRKRLAATGGHVRRAIEDAP